MTEFLNIFNFHKRGEALGVKIQNIPLHDTLVGFSIYAHERTHASVADT